MSGLGELTAATERAVANAQQIEDIRDEVKHHKESIDLVVRDANNARRELVGVKEISDRAKEKADEIEAILQKAQEALHQLRTSTDFGLLITKASNDDREAFNKLIDIGKDKESPFRDLALQAIENIIQDVDPLVTVRLDVPLPWKKIGVDPATADFDKYRELYRTSLRLYKLPLLSELWQQERFPKRQRLEFLAEVIRSDSSLRVLHRACVLMDKEAHLGRNILRATDYLEWWETNKKNY